MPPRTRKTSPWVVFARVILSAILILAAEHHLLTDQLVWHIGQYIGQLTKPVPSAPVDVVIVRLDNQVVANQRRNPYPRQVLLDVLKAVDRTPVAAVGLDIFLDEETQEVDQSASQALATQMSKMDNVIAAVRHVNGRLVEISPFFKGSVAGEGVADIVFTVGQPVRAMQTSFEEKPSLAAAMVKLWRKRAGSSVEVEWPEEAPLNMALPLGSVITHIDASTLLARGKLPIESQSSKPVFVLISPYDDYASDLFTMCLDGATYQQVHGGDVHAIAVATLLQPGLPFEWPEAPHGYIMWIGGVSVTFLFCRRFHHQLGAKTALLVICGLLVFAGVVMVFASSGSLLPIGLPAAGVLLGLHLAESTPRDESVPANHLHEAKQSESPPQTPLDA